MKSPKRLIILLLLAFFSSALFGHSAKAEPWPESDDLQKILALPQLYVEDEELNTDELKRFYEVRSFKPLWNFSGSSNSEAFAAFLNSLSSLIEYHGLQHEDYAIDVMRKISATNDNSTKLELLTTDVLLRLAHDLHGDSYDLANLYVGWNFSRADTDIIAGLHAAIASNSLGNYINSLAPQNPAYSQLATALEKYKALKAKGGWAPIDAGPTLLPGDHNIRVEQLRARLVAENYLPAINFPASLQQVFDEDLRRAALVYQTRNGLTVDGHIGPKALEALNTPIEERIDQIAANMERWRHIPDEFPPNRYALVNIPDASIVITEDGKPIYNGIVIVGRVDRKTPFIQSSIRSMIINPAWHVPAKIAKKDILPKLRKDPHYLEKLGFVIRGNEADPYGDKIDWKSFPEREFNFRLRQSPGDMNSLGRLKFDFDNDFAVYMHGTPHQELFKKNERSLSSGCIRLAEPEEVALIYLAHNTIAWNKDRLEEQIASGKTHWVGITQPMPLYVLYWTVFTDASGEVNFRKDIYDYDSFLIHNMRKDSKPLESH